MSTNQTVRKYRRKIIGIVVSDKNNKTITVNVERRFTHPKYGKYIHRSKKYHAHDPLNSAKVGDKVMLIESAPHSKLKKWELLKLL